MLEFSKPDPRVDSLNFLIKALSKREHESAYTKIIFIKDSQAVASDKKRLHWVNFAGDMPDGFYRVMKATKTKIILVEVEPVYFPDFSDLLKLAGEGICDIRISVENELDQSCALRQVFSKTRNDYNFMYILDVLKSMPEGIEVTERGLMLRFESGFTRKHVAILMSIRDI